jgi:hypothetical protein
VENPEDAIALVNDSLEVTIQHSNNSGSFIALPFMVENKFKILGL